MIKHKVYLSLGSNLGDKQLNITGAIDLINGRVGCVTKRSSLIATEPWGFESDNEFVNACVEVETDLQPLRVLEVTQQIERDMGRTSKSTDGQYHDRIIDIDLLLYDHIQLSLPQLVIPHPLMWQRDFVMKPLREICDVDKFRQKE